MLSLVSSLSFAQVIDLKGSWKFRVGDKPSWSATKFDDNGWETIKVPSTWEDVGFNGYDGFAWYRKKFDGRQLSKEQNYMLNLGYIDDTDEVYVNGVLIGFSGTMPPKFKTAYNSERNYSLPNDIINFSGDNIIAIRIFDVTQAGGIIDGDIGIYRAAKSHLLIDLQGLWQFTTSEDWKPVSEDTEWKKIMVPSPWEHQGYSRYDGFGWYKRSFTLDNALLGNETDLVLLLGKIDDFDKAYLNGKLIGSTKDGLPYLRSSSFMKIRAYSIPPNLLKKNGVNTIEVFVEDIGDKGGIYEGPVGITTHSTFKQYFR
jgi:Beta-galactosidase jelly roll domain